MFGVWMDGNDISCPDHFLLVTTQIINFICRLQADILKVFVIIMLDFFFYERKSFVGFSYPLLFSPFG
jgi:hypothetical protein